jgi:hypothetical protein
MSKCNHPEELVEITPPCCKFPDGEYGRWECGCYGQYSVYCSGCNNADMTDEDIEAILEAQYEHAY